MTTLDANLKGTARIECKGPLKIHRVTFSSDTLTLHCSFDGYRFDIELSAHDAQNLHHALDGHRIFPSLTEYPFPPEPKEPLTPPPPST